MSKLRNLVGLKVHHLTVIEFAGLTDDKKAKWKCLCDCGNYSIVSAANLTKKGRSTQSCGCKQGNRIYGPIPLKGSYYKFQSKEKKAYKGILTRCTRKSYPQYKDYGGRGIKCLFKDYEDFFNAAGEAPSLDHSIGRINNDGHYEHGNVRWETRKQQQRNTRFNRRLVYKGETKTIAEWAEQLGLNATYISHRLARGWTVERAIEYPIIERPKP